MNHQQPQGLPVSPVQIDGTAWVQQGLPQQPPFVPNLNVGHMRNLLPLITGGAMLTLQQNAQKNPLRTFCYNLCSRNMYQNAEFSEFLAAIVEFTEFLMAVEKLQPDQAIQTACEQMASIFVALNVRKFPALQQFVDPQMANDLNGFLGQFNQLKGAITQWQQAMHQPQPANMGWGGNAGSFGGGGMPMNMGMGGNMNMNMGGGGGWNNNAWAQPRPMNPAHVGGVRGGGPAMGMGGGFGGGGYGYGQPQQRRNVGISGQQANNLFRDGPGYGMPQPHSSAYDTGGNVQMGMGRRRRSGEAEELTFGNEGVTHERYQMEDRNERVLHNAGWPRAPRNDQGDLQERIQPAATNWTTGSDDFVATADYFPVGNEDYPRVKDVNRPYDSVFLSEGVEMRPAAFSGWQKTWTQEHPYHVIYNPETHILFHIRHADGTVNELAKPRTSDMDYLSHELDPKLRAGHQAQQDSKPGAAKVVAIDAQAVAQMRPHPKLAISTVFEATGEESTNDVSKVVTAQVIENVVQAHSLEEADTKISLNLPDGVQLHGRSPVEFYVDLVNTVRGNPNMIHTVKSLSQLTDFEEFRLKLMAALTQNQVSEEVYKLIDKRVTQSLNDALAKSMGLEGWRVDSFVDDWMDLAQLLTETYSKTLVEALKRHAADVIGPSVSVLSGDSFAKYLHGMGVEAGTQPKILVFRERVSVTTVPWSLDQVMATVEDGGLVQQSTMPNLFDAMTAIITRTSDQSIPFAKRYFSTVDKQLLEIRKGFLGSEAYLLFKKVA